MKQAYYHSSIEDFLKINEHEIIGKLNLAGTAFATQYTITTTSWDSSIQILKKSCQELILKNPSISNWHILLEYEIPRLSSRIDAVIIADDLIFVVEFKYDRKKYESADIRQVEDYVNDLFDFHLESNNRILIPVLLTPLAKSIPKTNNLNTDSFIKPCLKVNTINLSQNIYEAYLEFHKSSSIFIDPYKWEQSEYQPTQQ